FRKFRARLSIFCSSCPESSWSSASFAFSEVMSVNKHIAPWICPALSNNGRGLDNTLTREPSGRQITISSGPTSRFSLRAIAREQESGSINEPSGEKIFHDPHQTSLPGSGEWP